MSVLHKTNMVQLMLRKDYAIYFAKAIYMYRVTINFFFVKPHIIKLSILFTYLNDKTFPLFQIELKGLIPSALNVSNFYYQKR